MSKLLVIVHVILSFLAIILMFTLAYNIFNDDFLALTTIGTLSMLTGILSILAIILVKENRWISVVTLIIGIIPATYILWALVIFFVNPQP